MVSANATAPFHAMVALNAINRKCVDCELDAIALIGCYQHAFCITYLLLLLLCAQ